MSWVGEIIPWYNVRRQFGDGSMTDDGSQIYNGQIEPVPSTTLPPEFRTQVYEDWIPTGQPWHSPGRSARLPWLERMPANQVAIGMAMDHL